MHPQKYLCEKLIYLFLVSFFGIAVTKGQGMRKRRDTPELREKARLQNRIFDLRVLYRLTNQQIAERLSEEGNAISATEVNRHLDRTLRRSVGCETRKKLSLDESERRALMSRTMRRVALKQYAERTPEEKKTRATHASRALSREERSRITKAQWKSGRVSWAVLGPEEREQHLKLMREGYWRYMKGRRPRVGTPQKAHEIAQAAALEQRQDLKGRATVSELTEIARRAITARAGWRSLNEAYAREIARNKLLQILRLRGLRK
jgi:hypothetical protein